MLEYGATNELRDLLVRQGEIKPAAGTNGLGMKVGERGDAPLDPELPLQGRGVTAGRNSSGYLKLVWSR